MHTALNTHAECFPFAYLFVLVITTELPLLGVNYLKIMRNILERCMNYNSMFEKYMNSSIIFAQIFKQYIKST